MPSITATFARAMRDAAGTLAAEAGTPPPAAPVAAVCAADAGAEDRLSDRDYFEEIERFRASHPDPAALVFAYAETVRSDALGTLGLAMRTAPTLRDSLRMVERYFRLVTDNAVYRLEEGEEAAFFAIEARTDPHPALDFRNECALAGFVRNLRRLAGDGLGPECVWFRHPGRGDGERYARALGCPVRFGAERDAIVLSRAALDLPNRLGDAGVSGFFSARLEAEIAEMGAEEPPLKAELLRRLTPGLSNGAPSAAAVARDMGMSERTLYRRLAEAGTTYRDVLQDAQTRLARELLGAGDCSISEVAFLTGFSEQSAFARAFKRRVGRTPAQYRRGCARL